MEPNGALTVVNWMYVAVNPYPRRNAVAILFQIMVSFMATSVGCGGERRPRERVVVLALAIRTQRAITWSSHRTAA